MCVPEGLHKECTDTFSAAAVASPVAAVQFAFNSIVHSLTGCNVHMVDIISFAVSTAVISEEQCQPRWWWLHDDDHHAPRRC